MPVFFKDIGWPLWVTPRQSKHRFQCVKTDVRPRRKTQRKLAAQSRRRNRRGG